MDNLHNSLIIVAIVSKKALLFELFLRNASEQVCRAQPSGTCGGKAAESPHILFPLTSAVQGTYSDRCPSPDRPLSSSLRINGAFLHRNHKSRGHKKRLAKKHFLTN